MTRKARPVGRRTALKAVALAAAAPAGAASGCDFSRPADDNEEATVLDLSFRIAERYRPFAILAPGSEQVTEGPGRLTGLRLAAERPIAPFAAVQVSVDELSEAGLAAGLATESGDFVGTVYDPTSRRVSIEVRRDGSTSVLASRRTELRAPFDFAFVLCENQVTAVADSGAGWRPLLTERDGVAAAIDLRVEATLSGHAYAYGTRTGDGDLAVRSVQAGPFGYTGLRDGHLVQRPDGSAVIEDGRAYLTFTCAGMGFFQQAHWGVFTLDLADPTDLQQVAHLYSRRDGLLLGDHAGQLVVDDGSTVVGVSSWGDFAYDGVHIRHTRTEADLLHGVHLLETQPLALPTTHGAWDPSLTRIEGRWYVAFVESPSQDPFLFHPALAVGSPGEPYDTGLELVGVDDSMREAEGPIIARVSDDWHVLVSNKDTQTYPVYDLSLQQLGTLDAPYVTNIPHPQVIAIPSGGHLLVTFDGTPYDTKVLGYGGHGDVVVMKSP